MRRLACIVAAAVACFLAVQPAAVSEANASPLSNIEKVKVQVPDIDAYGKDCGLVAAELEVAFFGPLAERGVQEVTSGTPYRVVVRTTTLAYGEEACLTYADAQLLLSTRYFDPSTVTVQGGNIQLWATGGLYVSDIEEHSEVIRSALRSFGRQLAAALARATDQTSQSTAE